jgi:hypothetical protein
MVVPTQVPDISPMRCAGDDLLREFGLGELLPPSLIRKLEANAKDFCFFLEGLTDDRIGELIDLASHAFSSALVLPATVHNAASIRFLPLTQPFDLSYLTNLCCTPVCLHTQSPLR